MLKTNKSKNIDEKEIEQSASFVSLHSVQRTETNKSEIKIKNKNDIDTICHIILNKGKKKGTECGRKCKKK